MTPIILLDFLVISPMIVNHRQDPKTWNALMLELIQLQVPCMIKKGRRGRIVFGRSRFPLGIRSATIAGRPAVSRSPRASGDRPCGRARLWALMTWSRRRKASRDSDRLGRTHPRRMEATRRLTADHSAVPTMPCAVARDWAATAYRAHPPREIRIQIQIYSGDDCPGSDQRAYS